MRDGNLWLVVCTAASQVTAVLSCTSNVPLRSREVECAKCIAQLEMHSTVSQDSSNLVVDKAKFANAPRKPTLIIIELA